MVKIRLKRVGAKGAPVYRVVVADQTSPRDGRFIENLGFYNPSGKPELVRLDADRVIHWLSVGAVPTETTRSLLRKEGILKRWHDIRQGVADAAAPEEAEASEE